MTFTHVVLALSIVMVWGLNFVVIKLGLNALPPVLFSSLRFLFAAIPLVFFVPRPKVQTRLLLGYAFCVFFLQFVLLFLGMKWGISAGLASLVMQLQAFFTLGIAAWVLRDRPQAHQWMGALLALGGMAWLGLHMGAHSTLLGFLLVVGAALSWGTGNVITKKMGPVDALSLVVWGSLLAFPALFLTSLVIEGPARVGEALRTLSWRTLGAVLYQAYPTTVFGFAAWSHLIKRYALSTVAPFSLLVPIVGMAASSLMLGEIMYGWKIIASVLVMTGLALNQWGSRAFALIKTKSVSDNSATS